jgi:hypothetical protein
MGFLFRLLLLIGLAAIVWRLVRNALAPPSSAGPHPDAAPGFEPTARCARCGTHVPRTQLDPAGLCPRCR